MVHRIKRERTPEEKMLFTLLFLSKNGIDSKDTKKANILIRRVNKIRKSWDTNAELLVLLPTK